MKKVFFCLGAIIVFIGVIYYAKQPRIHFKYDEVHLALYDEVDPYAYIEEIEHMNIDHLKIVNHVNNQKLGEYNIEYIYENKHFDLKIFIDDKIPPEFETENINILKNETIDAKDLVKNIKDDSETIIYFKEDYIFNEVKTYRVTLVVEDAYENKTEKYAYVLVEEKDIQSPIVTGLSPLTYLVGDEIDLKEGVKVQDDHDKKPHLTIDDSQLKRNQVGDYEVYYEVSDKSGNKAKYTREVHILSAYDNREAKIDGKKTCYLTFDDGPSYNTPKVLDILDEYQIKATFFVTATSLKDAHYIKEAHEKGHAIGLHSYSHEYDEIYSSLANYLKDLQKIQDHVYKQTGEKVKIMRFPGGSSNMISKEYNVGIMKRLTKRVIDMGYQYYDWTSINGDGEGNKSVSELKKKAMDTIKDQEDIMFLMHDSVSSDNTVKALPYILDELIKQGYQFEIVNEKSPTFHHTVHN